MQEKFTWLEGFEFIIKELKEKSYSEEELINILYEIISIENIKGLTRIDPFTFLRYFNSYPKKRIEYINKLLIRLGSSIQINDDCGIPTVIATSVRMFNYKSSNKNDEINNLWELFNLLNEGVDNTAKIEDIIPSILSINGIGVYNLSHCFFYLNPNNFIPLDKHTVNYFSDKKDIISKIDLLIEKRKSNTATFRDFLEINNEIKKTFPSKHFYEISDEAFQLSISNKQPKLNKVKNNTASNEVTYWLFSPGENAKNWDEFYNDGIMSIGYDEIGDLRDFKSKEEIEQKLIELDPNKKFPMNHRLACFEFCNTIKVGDIIIPKKGRKEFLGYGIVTGDYVYDLSKKFKHFRQVKWIKKGIWNDTYIGPTVQKTLTSINKYLGYPERLCKIIGIETNENIINNNNLISNMNMNQPLNQILYGPPGTGKTFSTMVKALSIVGVDTSNLDLAQQNSQFNTKINEGQIVFTSFHQSLSYEDFIEGIKPEVEETNIQEINSKVSNIQYKIKDGIFKQICEAARTPNQINLEKAFNSLIEELSVLESEEVLVLKTVKNKSDFKIKSNSNGNITYFTNSSTGSVTKENVQTIINNPKIKKGGYAYTNAVLDYLKTKYNYSEKERSKQNYVIIIDEINRGNVAQIFGELITLIEENKRDGKAERIEITLPYSREKFSIPDNVYIIGTMNTTDRSIVSLDTALRRRFEFFSIDPDPELIKDFCTDVELNVMLKTINNRITKLLDKDYCIGHSYFMNESKVITLPDLVKIFKNKIIPLLQEYFYDDWSKIELILGSNFVKVDDERNSIKFAKNSTQSENNDDKSNYVITNSDNWDLEVFKSIYEE